MAARTHFSRRGCARRTWDPSCVPGDLQHPQPCAGDPQPGQEQRSPCLDSSSETRTHAQTRSHAHTLSRHHTFEGRSFLFLERLAEKQRVSFIYIVCEPDSHPRRTKLRLRAKRSDFFDWRRGEGGAHQNMRKDSRSVAPRL